MNSFGPSCRRIFNCKAWDLANIKTSPSPFSASYSRINIHLGRCRRSLRVAWKSLLSDAHQLCKMAIPGGDVFFDKSQHILNVAGVQIGFALCKIGRYFL